MNWAPFAAAIFAVLPAFALAEPAPRSTFAISPPSPTAPKLTTAYSFTYGSGSHGGLVSDASGNLYGTTGGSVFKLTPARGSGWTATVLYRFGSEGMPGYMSMAGVTLDNAGNIYGTTSMSETGYGTVFMLVPPGSTTRGPACVPVSPNAMCMRVLWSFTNGADGGTPYGGVVLSAGGKLYGTTTSGGATPNKWGVVFELDPAAPAGTPPVTLVDFGALQPQGGYLVSPRGDLAYDNKTGNLYGVAGWGIFQLAPSSSSWIFSVLHMLNFDQSEGYDSPGGMILDSSGNLYGTTAVGSGDTAYGTVFRLNNSGATTPWSLDVLYSFNGAQGQARNPEAGVAFGPKGTLWLTTQAGGASGEGAVVQLTPPGGACPAVAPRWCETWVGSLNLFKGANSNGAPLFVNGVLYATTISGGSATQGAVVQVK
ncbi:choice-of-anchor tandem repeat GloVer-containing protein [Methylocystis heyeri]|uniref:SMP-30/Gluconolactonase/LRE-like region domain-containing protein n=1 Tax=Methylocystis heyeri TaxID=391905 RepID=A0A6B8KAT6_9HYPH|nr:choice-of-anchor tandem repeat GloVer-containing protein [Methylocystis heyeri]QGM44612.1 hypothetical protein H2LOC_002305 [Methylocystis heyeri]